MIPSMTETKTNGGNLENPVVDGEQNMFITTSTLPSPASVSSLLTGIIGRPVAARELADPEFVTTGISYCGIYRDDLGTPQFACMYDLALAAHAGAALLLLPPSRARDNVAAGVLEHTIEDNVRDILKIQARMFDILANRHIHLSEVICRMATVPDRIERLIPTPAVCAQFEASIHGYGAGKLWVICLADPLARLDDAPMFLPALSEMEF